MTGPAMPETAVTRYNTSTMHDSHTPPPLTSPTLQRDFTVATFVVHESRVLLLMHQKLQMWLPPGGHIEPNELPDEAAVHEVLEETGIHVQLAGERGPEMEGGPRA